MEEPRISRLAKLAAQMRKDWDRRVGHDYRFWMSDGYRDDSHMWETGKRDFTILSEGVPTGKDRTALEIGCGVGRMLPTAAEKFGRVVGFDVSQRAIDKARELLGPNPAIELVVGSGVDLQPIPDASVDFVWSFAALTSMPTPVIARYLTEIQRVLKPGGVCRLQVYLGEEMFVAENDTLHLRCFRLENFENGARAAGLEVTKCFELILPIQVSFKEIGVEAFIVSLEANGEAPADPEEIAKALLPRGEDGETPELSATDLEAWMAINYAEQCANEGDMDRARQALEYVETYCRSSAIDTRDILDRIVNKSGPSESTVEAVSEQSEGLGNDSQHGRNWYQENLGCLQKRFPAAAERLKVHAESSESVSSLKWTQDGPAVSRKGLCLDHADKPKAAADAWVARSLQEQRVANSNHLVAFGFGCGYHLETMLKTSKKVSCIEPHLGAFKLALEARDVRPILEKLTGLSVGDPPEISFLSSDSELLVRPQHFALDGEMVGRVKGEFYGLRGLSLLKPKIAVLGPLQGGTGPIGQYTYSALARLGQRTRGLDMSGFNSGFELLDSFVNLDLRKNMLRSAYVEMLSTTLLETFNEKPIDILLCMAQAPVSPRLLTELRKRGVITVLWFVEDYLRFTYWREMARYYDFIFTIQKDDCLQAIKSAGAGEVHYLPLACDPYFHAPLSLTPEDKEKWGSPLSFVGAGYHNRQQMFASLSSYPFRIWGSEWPGCKPFDRMVQEEARRIAPEEYLKIFNATDINLNLHSSTERDGVDPTGDFVNPRTFELAACGAFQLVDERSLLSEVFTPGEEVITFNSLPDLKDKISYYKDRPEERREIADKARLRAMRDHTYDKRMQQMLSFIYATKFEHLKAREQTSPWAKMIEESKPYPELHERCKTAFERGEEPNLDALISDIVTGKGKLTETEQKLLFLFHVRKQIIRMAREESGDTRKA